MFERFTDRARRAVVLAQEEARRLDHNYIGTEHILLGLIREGEGVAAEALSALDVSLEDGRREVESVTGRGGGPQSGHIPFTPRAKKVLELSLRESRQLGHDYIGTGHILLGVAREGEGAAAQVLVRLGAGLDQVRQEVIRFMRQGKSEAGSPSPSIRTAGTRDQFGDVLDRLRAVLTRLDEIADRLAAIERRLGGGEPPGAQQAG